MSVRILIGDVRDRLAELPDESVHCVVTSPPYWGMRDYGVAGQLGLEADFRDYIAELVAVFRDVRRVLRRDGTLWLNLGDSYATGAGKVGDHPGGGAQGARWAGTSSRRPAMGKQAYLGESIGIGPATQPNRMPQPGLKPKDLVGMPWRVALALQEDGWWLRQDIIWHKPNPMPESITDRPTTAHEHLFLLSRSERYFYTAAAIMEPSSPDSHARARRGRSDSHKWADGGPGDQTIARGAPSGGRAIIKHGEAPQDYARLNRRQDALHNRSRGAGVNPKAAEAKPGTKQNASFSAAITQTVLMRNKRSVWIVASEPFGEAHFATYPPALIEPCVLAGCPEGGTVLDPFFGAGTTGLVADRLGRHCIGIELNPEYADMARRRIQSDAGLFGEVA